MELSDRELAEQAKEQKENPEEIKKKVAQAELEKETGYTAATMAEVAKTVLNARDQLGKTNGDIVDAMGKVDGVANRDLIEKMKDSKIAKKIVQAGLGSEHTSTGEAALEQGAQEVSRKENEEGWPSELERRLGEASMNGSGINPAEARKMTPEELKTKVEQAKEEKAKTEQKENDESAQRVLGINPKNRPDRGGR